MMKYVMTVAVLFALLPAAAAKVKPVDETFLTADGVRLKGRFYKCPRPASGSPVVILMYEPGVGRSMDKSGDWSTLLEKLEGAGFHAFQFDWRGHGRSTDIVDTDGDGSGYTGFWSNGFTGPWNNKMIQGARRRPVKNDLFVKNDIRNARYFPVYVNDLAAVRVHLDGKNDQNDLSTSSIYLIGAGDSAVLGLLWMAAEWMRPAIHPLLGGGASYKAVPTAGIIADPVAGQDIAGAVWLSADRPEHLRESTITSWSKHNPKLRVNNPMLFLYGERDSAQERMSKFVHDVVLVAKGNKSLGVAALDQTFIVPLKSSAARTALLGNNDTLETEDTIMKYLSARQKDRVSVVRRERKYYVPYFIDLGHFGLNP